MRKQILALLSALGLAGSAAPASAQKPKDGTSNTIKAESTLKRAKAARENKASELGRQFKANKASATKQGWSFGASNPADSIRRPSNHIKTSSALKSAQASRKRAGNGETTNVIPPGPNVLKTRKIPPGPNSVNLKAGRADFRKFQTGPAKTLTLNPQPLPPGVHTANPQPTPPGIHPMLNPQPLPPGIHTLNPQPLPPGVHTSDTQMTSSPNKTAIGSGTSGAGASKDTNKAGKSAPKPQ